MRPTAATYDRMPAPSTTLWAFLPRNHDLTLVISALAMALAFVAVQTLNASALELRRAHALDAFSRSQHTQLVQRVAYAACPCPLFSDDYAAAIACEKSAAARGRRKTNQ